MKLNLDKTSGKITIKKEPSTLSKSAAQIKTIIGDKTATVQIAVSNNDSNVLGGQFDGNGHQTLDFADIKKLSKKGGFTKESIVIHETTEAYEGLKNGNNFPTAHSTAVDFENDVRASQGSGARVLNSETVIATDAAKQTQTFSVDFTTHMQEITVRTNGGQITGDILRSKVRKKP